MTDKYTDMITWRAKHIAMLMLCLMTFTLSCQAQKSSQQKARQLFDQVFQQVYGPQGSTLHYDVNLIGLYKTSGTIWYKGKKSKFVEGRYIAWNDGQTHHLVDTKKHTVTLYDATSDKKDKYSSNFKFVPDDYTYSMATTTEGIELTLTLKKGRKGMKLVKALLDKKTHAPINLRIKVAFFWAHIGISNFRSGNISDNTFVFPKKQYADYETIDKRE